MSQDPPITCAWPDAWPTTAPRLEEIGPNTVVPVTTVDVLSLITCQEEHTYQKLGSVLDPSPRQPGCPFCLIA
jgi:hypothetical protein